MNKTTLRHLKIATISFFFIFSTTQLMAFDKPLCGMGNGQKAVGKPILLGAIVGETGPDDFSSTSDAAMAYFKCVNENGGINGRPIKYLVEDDQWNPEVAAQAGTKLVKDVGVIALVAGASFIEMGVNAQMYVDEKIVSIPSACATSDCFESTNISSTNGGPLTSNLLAAQWAVEKLGSKNIACIGLNIPTNGGWSCNGVISWLKANGYKGSAVLFDPGAADFTSVVLEAVATGADTLELNLAGNLAVGILKAAEEQDLAATHKFISAAPLYDEDIPKAIGSYWNDRLHVNLELTPLDGTGPDNVRWRKVMDKYGKPDDTRDVFSQAGFLAANIVVDTLLKMNKDKITRETVFKALKNVKNYSSDLTCSPWYFGPGDTHIPLHTGMMSTVKNGKFDIVHDCFRPKGDYYERIYEMEKKYGLAGN